MPLDNGAQDIRALDGLRAAAALSIVLFHMLHRAGFQYSQASRTFGNYFWFLATGVHLFFVLSGFLLFLPYARAMLRNQPLPSARRFYRRRALRVLPAYLVVLAILAWLPTSERIHPLSAGSVITHLFMIHDSFPPFNRDFEGPFWTLAIEAQFYLLLPLFALVLAKIVGGSRSVLRLLGGVGLLMLVALGVRTLDTLLTSGMAATTTSGFSYYWVLATMGVQGKYLEVFMVGMIASVLYVVTVEFGGLSPETRRRLGWVTLAAGIILLFTAIQNNRFAGPIFAPGAIWGPGELFFPLLAGAAYSTLLLSIVWGRHPVRWFFETPPMRFIGLISYSLYLWHLPVIHVMIPIFAGVPLVLRAVCAVLVAYLSYQLVERPFLKRRRRDDAPARTIRAPEPPVVREHAAPAAARQ